MTMLTAFVSVSFQHKDALAAELDAIETTLRGLGVRAVIFVRDFSFGPGDEHAMMDATQVAIRGADLLIAEVTHKAIGVGIEVGYAAALGKAVIYVRHAAAEHSTTVGGIAVCSIAYEDMDGLQRDLTAAVRRLVG